MQLQFITTMQYPFHNKKGQWSKMHQQFHHLSYTQLFPGIMLLPALNLHQWIHTHWWMALCEETMLLELPSLIFFVCMFQGQTSSNFTSVAYITLMAWIYLLLLFHTAIIDKLSLFPPLVRYHNNMSANRFAINLPCIWNMHLGTCHMLASCIVLI